MCNGNRTTRRYINHILRCDAVPMIRLRVILLVCLDIWFKFQILKNMEKRVDLILLDFRKARMKVSFEKVLLKMQEYSIRGKTLKTFLRYRTPVSCPERRQLQVSSSVKGSQVWVATIRCFLKQESVASLWIRNVSVGYKTFESKRLMQIQDLR